jgi:antitoxin HicB
MQPPELNGQIIARGRGLFATISGEKPSLFTTSTMTGKVMEWCLRNEEFKTRLFRFVDVFPALTTSHQLTEHIRQYFGIDGGFTVTCRDFPEAITQEETVAQAIIEASDAIEEAISSRIKRNVEIPEPSLKKQGEYMAAVPLSTSLKAALSMAMREDGISKSELARRMVIDEKEVHRMPDPRHSSKTPGMERALACLGRS